MMSEEKVEEIKLSKNFNVLRSNMCVVEEYKTSYKQVLVEEVLLHCSE
jgi:hypothetical protein